MQISTGYSEKTLEELLLKRMIDENIMCGDIIDCGWSLQQIAFQNKYDIFDLMNVLFPEGIENSEVMDLLDSIYVWGTATELPCPMCGNTCDHEDDGGNDLWTCSNHECDFKDTTGPDVDALPGGYAYNSEN